MSDETGPITVEMIDRAMGCEKHMEPQTYFQHIADTLNTALAPILALHAAAAAAAAAMRAIAAEAAYRTPFRAHAPDDVDFHSGCKQTQDAIVDAIRALAIPGDSALRRVIERAVLMGRNSAFQKPLPTWQDVLAEAWKGDQ